MMESQKVYEPEWGDAMSPRNRSVDQSALAFHSNDFDWEELREEIEQLRGPECVITGFDEILEAERRHEAHTYTRVFSPSAWEAFHKNHSKALFFKERRYLVKEFPELVHECQAITVLEVGCGTGSSVAPILRANSEATCYGCDCSPAALDRAKLLVTHQAGLHESQSKKFRPFLCDISVETFPSWLCCALCRSLSTEMGDARDEKIADSGITPTEVIPPPSAERTCCVGGVTVVMLIFTLSAMPLEKMRHVLAECAAVLQPGGYFLFRDYGTSLSLEDNLNCLPGYHSLCHLPKIFTSWKKSKLQSAGPRCKNASALLTFSIIMLAVLAISRSLRYDHAPISIITEGSRTVVLSEGWYPVILLQSGGCKRTFYCCGTNRGGAAVLLCAVSQSTKAIANEAGLGAR